MNHVHDCRKGHRLTGEMSEDGTYIALAQLPVTPKYDDLLIGVSGDVFVVNHAQDADEKGEFYLRLSDTHTRISCHHTPQYRKLKRAILSQIKRKSHR